MIQGSIDSEVLRSSDENLPKTKSSHCSHCGHPGSKISHLKFSCEYCGSTAGQSCKQKFVGFKCDCLSCDLVYLLTLSIPSLFQEFFSSA